MASDYTSLLLFFITQTQRPPPPFHNLCIVLRYYTAHWVPCSWSHHDTHLPRELSTTSSLDIDSRYTLSPHSPHPPQFLRSWNIVRHDDTHHHTLQLILVTVTLNRYHNIWYTLPDTRQQPDLSTPPVPYPLRDDAYDELNTCWLTSIIDLLSTGEVRSFIPRSKWWYLSPHGQWF